jgi:nitronate monooxygenase
MWGGSPSFTQKLKMYFKVLTSKFSFAKELDLAKAEAKAWSTIWSAGQGVTNIQDTLSVKDLVSNIKNEFKESLAEQAKLLDKYL